MKRLQPKEKAKEDNVVVDVVYEKVGETTDLQNQGSPKNRSNQSSLKIAESLPHGEV